MNGMFEVFQPFPIVGCGFVEDAGTNTANQFTGCAAEWPGGTRFCRGHLVMVVKTKGISSLKHAL